MPTSTDELSKKARGQVEIKENQNPIMDLTLGSEASTALTALASHEMTPVRTP
jgi:hypothetical protein